MGERMNHMLLERTVRCSKCEGHGELFPYNKDELEELIENEFEVDKAAYREEYKEYDLIKCPDCSGSGKVSY